MRKTYIIPILTIVFLAFFFSFGFGQEVTRNNIKSEFDDERPTCYLGFSSGKDNMVGFLGTQVDLGVTKSFSVGGGIGISSWGLKYAVNLRLSDDGLYGAYFKLGYSHNTGIEELEVALDSYNNMIVNLEPIDNLFLTMGWVWKINEDNRLYAEIGYAWPTSEGDYYTIVNDNYQLSDSQKKAMKWLKPGGLVIAVGFNFAIFSL